MIIGLVILLLAQSYPIIETHGNISRCAKKVFLQINKYSIEAEEARTPDGNIFILKDAKFKSEGVVISSDKMIYKRFPKTREEPGSK